MKKILYSILVIFIVSSCSHLDDYHSIDMGTGPDITISVSNITVDSFRVTISPAAGTGYYSYLVLENEQNLTPSLVFQNSYTGLADGTLKYSESSSYSFTVEAESGQTYYIYAIAGNENGVLGDLVSNSVTTRTISQEQIVGTYTMAVFSYFDEDTFTESNIVIEAISADTLSISNLFEDGTVVYATWDIAGYLYIEDDQYLTDWNNYEVYFANGSAAAPVAWRYNENGYIYGTGMWGYYLSNPDDEDDGGWYDLFTTTTLEPSASISPGSVQSTNAKVQNITEREIKLRTGLQKNK